MKILISAPSLDTIHNVSGISSVVNNILSTTTLNYIHFEVGKQDKGKRDLKWILKQIYLPIKLFIVFLTNKIDIFHLNAPLNKLSIIRDFTLLLIAKLLRKKVLLHLHGGVYLTKIPENKLLLNFLKFYLKLGNKIITLSEYEKELVSSNYNISLKNIYSLQNCVIPLENIEKDYKEMVRVIFLGRIVKEKGINEIIFAMKKLYEKRKDFEFYVYGTGPLEYKINDELSISMKNNFQFKGIVFGKNKDQALIDADIFILPSYFEGLPISLLEAMNGENICIASNVGSISTVIENNTNGFIIKEKNSEELLLKLDESISLIKNGDRRIAINAKKTILEKYNSDIYSKKLKEIYIEVLSC